MWKVIGGGVLLISVAEMLYSWTLEQKKKQKYLEELIIFFQKSVSIMQNEKIKVIKYFETQNLEVFQEISRRLSTNTYPNGQTVWEEVFREEEQKLSFDKESFHVILQAGNGFFGRNRDENVRFLEKSITELETCQRELKEKDAQERKVWIPVGMLGALMIVIIFV